jgi:proline iminopeptidase
VRLVAALAVVCAACLDPGAPDELVPRTADQDPSLPQIEIAGAHLHAQTFGDPRAPMVMVLHGGPGSDYRNLLPLAALADDGYFVVFWDQRGAGLSQRFDGDHYAIDAYLDDLRLVIEHYTSSPQQPIVFLGHSWGAMYATAFIDAHGDYGGRVRGAILSEPGAFTEAQLERFLAGVQGSLDIAGERFNDALWQYQFLSPADHERADYLQAGLSFGGLPSEAEDPANHAPFWRRGAVVNAALLHLAKRDGFDWTTHLGAFRHPVLFLRGDRNTVATLPQQQELAAAYADATIVTMADVGHEMIWERPDEYLAHARAYLTSIGVTGGAP